MARKMLNNETEADKENKYLILISDGGAFSWYDETTSTTRAKFFQVHRSYNNQDDYHWCNPGDFGARYTEQGTTTKWNRSFGDLMKMSESVVDTYWAANAIALTANLGWINGYPDGTFGPGKLITRAEAVTIVNRTLDRNPDQDHFLKDMLVWVDNMDTSKWYYEAMQEATNSHEYEMKGSGDNKYENWTKMLEIRDWAAFEKEWSDANSATGGEVVK